MATFLIHTDQLPELAKLIAEYMPGLLDRNPVINIENVQAVNPKKIMSVDELRDFLPNKPSRSSIYGLTHRGKIPFHKPTGRHLYFIKEEIEQWISKKHSEIPTQFTQKPKSGRPSISHKKISEVDNQ